MTQRSLDFLNTQARRKTVRTALHGDQEFSLWELEIIHTPVFQRLYDLKQLGFADRVYPDAVHSRFNHVLGVTLRAEQMLLHLVTWLTANERTELRYVGSGITADISTISGKELANLLSERVEAVRLIGLLHDLTHAAYGHTLEDEVQVFTEKHDAPSRQRRFFDTLIAQLLAIWTTECGLTDPDIEELEALRQLNVDSVETLSQAEELGKLLEPSDQRELVRLLKQLEIAMLSILHIEYLHGKNKPDLGDQLLIRKVIETLAPGEGAPDHVIHRDAILVDIVGNTICADLLDYAERDSSNAGLRVQFDVRLMRYMVAVSVQGPKSPDGRPCIRLAVQFFTNKMRHDVLSEMSGILKARYLISERILFHPTKCAAGAMLGTAIQLLGLKALPEWVQTLGDSETLRVLNQTATNVHTLCQAIAARSRENVPEIAQRLWPSNQLERELALSCLREIVSDTSAFAEGDIRTALVRMQAARLVLWRIAARRFPKLVFRLRSEVQHSGGVDADKIANRFAECRSRFEFERAIENRCALPVGSVFIHCPPRKTSMKVAEALVVGADLAQVAHLREVTEVCREGLGPYQQEIRAVEQMYSSIWQFHGYLDVSQMHKRALVALAFAEESGFPNDTLLKVEQVDGENANPYERLATDLRGEVAPNLMSRVVKRLDETAPAWQANTLNAREIAMSTIREITAKAAAPAKLPPADTHVKDGAALNKDQPRSISPAPAEASEPLLLEEFSEILHEVRLSKRELQSSYRALLKYRDEQSRSWEDIRARVRRFADSLSQPPLSSDLFHGGSENRAVAHRLPKTPGEWEKD